MPSSSSSAEGFWIWESARLVTQNVALDEFRDDWGYRELEVPLLSKNIRMNRHVLALYCQFHWQRADFDHFADLHADGKRKLVAALVRIPIDEHVRRRTDPP